MAKMITLVSIFLSLALGLHANEELVNQDLLTRLRRSTERDPYVFNLFEVILTTLETKLRRVENMDKALEHLARRLDLMEGQLSVTLNTTSKIIHLLDVRFDSGCFKATETVEAPKQVTRVVRHRPYTGYFFEGLPEKRNSASNSVVRGPSSGIGQRATSFRRLNDAKILEQPTPLFAEEASTKRGAETIPPSDLKMEKQLDEVVKRVAMIDTKLSNLQEQLDTNTITKQTEELMASASENYRIGIGLGDRLQAVEKKQDFSHLEDSLDDVRNSLQSVSRRLQIHADSSGQNFDALAEDMVSLKKDVDNLSQDRKKDWCMKQGNSTSSSRTVSADGCVSPFVQILNKSDQIMNSMMTIKDLEVLEPRAMVEEQLSQGKVLEEIKKKVDDSSSKILKDLQEVKKDIRRVRLTERENNMNRVNPIALLQKTTGSSNQETVVDASSPPSDILDQRILSQTNESSGEANSDRTRHAGVIFPQKHKKPVESGFISSSLDSEIKGYSCLDLLKKGQKKSGTYHLKIRGTTYWFLQVYCDMNSAGGGWTVIQRRDDYGEPRENFNRGWADYKHGFGHPEKELWLGNENIYMLTNTDDYVLRVELEDFDGSKRYAEYNSFKLHDENNLYKLEIGGYNGTAGDALNDPWYGSNLSPFSTMDKDNDRSSLNCASMLKGGWWWRSCGRGLNGLYLTNPNDFTARQGIVWFRWRGWDYTLKRTVLMIRPKMIDEDEAIS